MSDHGIAAMFDRMEKIREQLHQPLTTEQRCYNRYENHGDGRKLDPWDIKKNRAKEKSECVTKLLLALTRGLDSKTAGSRAR